jgi:hypothetical protein
MGNVGLIFLINQHHQKNSPMKCTTYLSAVVLATAATVSSCSNDDKSTTTNTDSLNTSTVTTTAGSTRRTILSEADGYIDLKTGKTIRIRKDPANNTYVAEDMTPLDIYVNTVTYDTFWGPEAVPVNNALIHDASGMWIVDEMRVERNGEGYKAKSEDGELKIKDNENELKMKDGDAKLKSNENEYKYKDDGIKVKSNEDKTKIKTRDSKTEIDHRTGEVETKYR